MNKMRNVLLGILSMITATAILIPNSIFIESNAVCKGVGTAGFNEKVADPYRNVIKKKSGGAGSGKFAASELFNSNAAVYALPYGVREEASGPLGILSKNDYAASITNETAKEKLISRGDGEYSCLGGYQLNAMFTNVSKAMADSITGLIVNITQMYFNPKLLCENPTDKDCFINLVKIVGGENDSNGGLLKKLSNGIFTPLASLAFISTAVWMTYEGLWKRKFRVGLLGLGWALFAFALGLIVVNKPTLVASAPQKINSVISGCILEAVNGGSCLSPGSSAATTISGDELCTINRAGIEPAVQSVTALTCNVWRGFSLNRWSEQMFGYSFDQLYTQGTVPTGDPLFSGDLSGANGTTASSFCVDLNGTVDSSGAKMSGTTVCNIALAYMALRTKGEFTNLSATMEDIVVVAASDDVMWGAITGDGRDLMGTSVIISTIAAAVAFLPITLYGLAYSITSSILVVFAPIFLLFAIHPGKGKKMFLGWLEAVVSAHLKFMATGILLVVMLSMFAAIISTTTAAIGMIMSIIMAVAFISYRQELVNIIGAANMGGIKISNRAEKALNKSKDKIKQTATVMTGSSIGKMVAAKENGESIWKAGFTGAGYGLTRQLSRGNGLVANGFRTFKTQNAEMKKGAAARQKAQEEQARAIDDRAKMEEQLDKTAAVLGKDRNVSRKNKMLREQSSHINSLDNQALIDSANRTRENIENAPASQQSLDTQYNNQIKIQTEETLMAKALNENDSKDAQSAVDDYIKDFRTHEEAKIEKDAKALENDERLADLTPAERAEVIQDFKNRKLEELDTAEKEIRQNIGVTVDKETGESQLTHFGGQEIAEAKDKYRNSDVQPNPNYRKPKPNVPTDNGDNRQNESQEQTDNTETKPTPQTPTGGASQPFKPNQFNRKDVDDYEEQMNGENPPVPNPTPTGTSKLPPINQQRSSEQTIDEEPITREVTIEENSTVSVNGQDVYKGTSVKTGVSIQSSEFDNSGVPNVDEQKILESSQITKNEIDSAKQQRDKAVEEQAKNKPPKSRLASIIEELQDSNNPGEQIKTENPTNTKTDVTQPDILDHFET